MATKKVTAKPKTERKPKAEKVTTKTVWEMRKEYFDLKMDILRGKEKNTAKLKQIRKQIARSLTQETKSKLTQTNGD